MVSSDVAQIMSLHAGEAYAMQNLTKTDRLGLLISGKVSFIYSGVVGIYDFSLLRHPRLKKQIIQITFFILKI